MSNWLQLRNLPAATGRTGRGLERASPENPSTPLSDPAAWLFDAWGANPTNAGTSVSEATARAHSAFWACEEIRSKTLAMVGCHVYRRLENGGRERATEHPVYRLLHTQANPEMTAFIFHQTLDSHVGTWGNGYAEIERARNGRPLALWPLLPDRTEPVRISAQRATELGSRFGAGKYLRTRLENGAKPPAAFPVVNSEVYIPPGFYLHVPGLGFDGLRGYSRVRFARQALGLGLAAEEYQARFFGSGLKPSFLLTTDYQLKPGQAEGLRAKLEEYQAGLSQSHRAIILEKGLNVQQLGMPLDDAQFLESRKFQVEDIARFWDMPLHRLRVHAAGGGHNTIEGQQLDFVQGTILAPATAAQQVFTVVLLDAGHFAEYHLPTLLKADSKSRGEFYRTLLNIGAMTPNEIRRRENLNPVDEDGADRLWMQMNMAPLGDLADLPAPGIEPSGGDDADRARLLSAAPALATLETRQRRSATSRWRIQQAQIRLIVASAKRFVGREVEQLRRLVTTALNSREPFDVVYLRELEAIYNKFPRQVRRALLPVMVAFGELIANEVANEVANLPDDAAEDAERAAQDFVTSFTTRHIGSSRGQLGAVIRDAGEIEQDQADAVLERLGQWNERRPGKIGNREAPRGGNEMARALFLVAGTVFYETWHHLGGDCGICRKLHGRRVGVGHIFIDKGETVESAQDGQADMVTKRPTKTPPAHDGCSNCMIVAG